MTDQATSPVWTHFDVLGEKYDKERPGYPASAVEAIVVRLQARSPQARVALDIGCGTGIFTRLLAERLGKAFEVKGIEPSFTMRQNAIKTWHGVEHIEFMEGSAEQLPVKSNSISLLTAAGSAQLFDRVRFYAEVDRVLVADGLLALVQNKRRHKNGFFQAFERFLETYVPDYRTGTYADAMGGHSTAEFQTELLNCTCFDDVAVEQWDWSKSFTLEGFEYFASSTVQMRLACATHGMEIVRNALRSLLEDYCNDAGCIDADYTTEVTSAWRKRCLT